VKATRASKNRWLDRAGFYGTQLTVCTTEAMFKKEYARMTKAPYPASLNWCEPGMACVHVLVSPSSTLPAQIICIDTADNDPILIAAMLAHEVVHVKQETMRVIGEKNPSSEFEAYFVQNTLENVLREYQRQIQEP
jgi:hypothetical protein